MTTPEEIQSKTIALLRFPLIAAVVFVHCTLEETLPAPTPLYGTLVRILKYQLGGIAVPLFFFLSGYLFFYKRSFSPSVYAEKLRRRACTLLIPYLLWNALFILLYWAAHALFPGLFTGKELVIADLSPAEVARLFWDGNDSCPLDQPLWFLRDLMVATALAPLVHALLRRGRGAGLAVLGLLFLATPSNGWEGFLQLPAGLSAKALFFFGFGAWFSIRGRLFTGELRRLAWPAAAAGAGLFAVEFLGASTPWLCETAHRMALVCGTVAVSALARWGVERRAWRPVPFLWSATFFIYAYHLPFTAVAKKLLLRLAPDAPAGEALLLNAATVAVLCLLGAAAYHLLARLCPRFTALLCGGR